MYLALGAAVVVAMWLTNSSAAQYVKCAIVALAVLFTMPNLSAAYWDTAVDTPSFFSGDAYRQYLKPREITLVVPYGWRGNSMMWHAQADLYFRMAGGWTGVPPAEFERWPAMVALYNGAYLPEPELQLKAFLAAHQVTAVLLDARAKDSPDPAQRQEFTTVIAALGVASVKAGNVLIYRFSANDLSAWSGLSTTELELRADEARFAALVQASQRYLESGSDVSQLSPKRLEEMGLIRPDWIGGPNIRIGNGLWAESRTSEAIEIGTFGSRAALQTLASKYRASPREVRFIAIQTSENISADEELQLLVMTFDRKGLEQAATLSRSTATHDNCRVKQPEPLGLN
jgi:hypothetical protein